ncbi:hypothetical protein HanXRQr2_Chr16g0749771 [Helianthus annuus]|uniref:Uncharacterized protein n=1 Tax=Helianthus annuus TaxID=4232 RepID=A0A9K3GXY9_HELAN|nr:hypothetical protein HanXRQr2_Chr16g0749771 [Helianthus annuus]
MTHPFSTIRVHYLDIVGGVEGESVVDSGWQNDEVASLDPNANPTIIVVPDIKIPTPFQTITYLFVCMNVLCIEVLQLLLIILHFLRAQIQQILQNEITKAKLSA